MKKKKVEWLDIVVHLILLGIMVCILYPMLHVVAVSFSDKYSVMANKITIFPKGFSLDSYRYVLEDGRVLKAFGYTVCYTALGVVVNVVMTILMAYPLSKEYLVGRAALIRLVMFTMFFSGGMIPTFLLVKELQLLDTVWSLVLPNAIVTMHLIIMINFYRSIPQSLYEAACLDGASEFLVLRKVVIPLSKASIASIALFCFMIYWNDYYRPMLYLFDSDKFPLQMVLREMLLEATETTNPSASAQIMVANKAITPTGVKNATMVISMVPVLCIYPFAQKYFVKGVMIGSVKG